MCGHVGGGTLGGALQCQYLHTNHNDRPFQLELISKSEQLERMLERQIASQLASLSITFSFWSDFGTIQTTEQLLLGRVLLGSKEVLERERTIHV